MLGEAVREISAQAANLDAVVLGGRENPSRHGGEDLGAPAWALEVARQTLARAITGALNLISEEPGRGRDGHDSVDTDAIPEQLKPDQDQADDEDQYFRELSSGQVNIQPDNSSHPPNHGAADSSEPEWARIKIHTKAVLRSLFSSELLDPPIDILPYLSDERDTFAAALFWRSLEYAHSSLLSPSPSFDASGVQPRYLKTFAHTIRHYSPDTIRRRIVVRLRFRRRVEVRKADTQKADSSATARDADRFDAFKATDIGDEGELRWLHKRVIQDMMHAGDSISHYLTPQGVEAHLRRQCSTPLPQRLPQRPRYHRQDLHQQNSHPVTDNHQKQHFTTGSTTTSQQLLRALIDALAYESVCFGDGPRFKIDLVDGTLRQIMQSASVR